MFGLNPKPSLNDVLCARAVSTCCPAVVCQGPCALNQRTLSQTNFIVTCNRIFGYLEHIIGKGAEMERERARLKSKIKCGLLNLLLR